MDVGQPWASTSSPCCWWPWGLLPWWVACSAASLVPLPRVDGQVPVTLSGCKVTSQTGGEVGHVGPPLLLQVM